MQISLYTEEECEKIASEASLRYVKDAQKGIYRKKYKTGFVYYDSNDKKITDKNTLQRIKKLAIPPAYEKVWICAYANGHIQATGVDSKKRKQYVYHSLWNEARQEQKFKNLIDFGKCLPKIRKHIHRQLNKELQLNKEQVLCAIIYLLDTSCIRIGTPLYAEKNHSYGLTTLRKKHLSIKSKKAELTFPGKNLQIWNVILKNKKIIKILKKCEEIPGYELFKYYSSGGVSVIKSQDVNGYLQSLTGHSFSAKTFRTWIACRETLCRLIKTPVSPENFKTVIQEVANLLGHTPSICKKNYIDPELIEWWNKGWLGKLKRHKTNNKDLLLLKWLFLKNKPT